MARLAAEQDNVRAALRWSLDQKQFEVTGRLLRRPGRGPRFIC
jgi:hypothetical protein